MPTSLLENGTLHARCWQREVLFECGQAGIKPGACPTALPLPLSRRLEREYELCDAIIVPSTTARRSFAEFGLAQKTHVVWPGVDSDFFSPLPSLLPSPKFRACYVGRIGLAKGVTYLLQAWKTLALPQAELVLVGPVQPDIRPILAQYVGSNIMVTGPLPPRQVADLVTITSTAGRVARPGSAVYNLTKFGAAAFSEALRQELISRRVRVSVIEPGTVDTELASHLRDDIREAARSQTATIEPLRPDDIADTVAYIVTRDRRVAVNEMLVRAAEQTW